MSYEKKFTLNDAMNLTDPHSINGVSMGHEGPTLRGRAVFRDAVSGEILFRKDNLIVLRGRGFVLEKLFGKSIPSTFNSGYLRNLNRTICFFKIGTGGCPVNVFQPEAPVYDNTDLAQVTPFRIVPSGEQLTEDEKQVYFGPSIDGLGNTSYYYKRFETQGRDADDNTVLYGSWILDQSNDPETGNQVAYKLVLKVDELDSRGTHINEISLMFADEIYEKDELDNIIYLDEENLIPKVKEYRDPEIFSRLTFPTEPLAADSKKSLLIEYFIYA